MFAYPSSGPKLTTVILGCVARKTLIALGVLVILAAAVYGVTQLVGDDEPETTIAGETAEPGDDEAAPPDPDASDEEVIDNWAKALTDGDTDAAAEYFALPSVAENGILIDIKNRDDAVLFNESLPCGAELENAETDGEFTTASFRLTSRPGSPECPGEGATAQTTFVIEDGLIQEWRRADVPGDEAPTQSI